MILGWEGQAGTVNVNMESSKDIDPKARQLVHVVFSDSSFPTRTVDPPSPIDAVISSRDALVFRPPRIIEHGFVPGDFIVKISITCERASCEDYFRIRVGNEWNRLTMSKLRWFEKNRFRNDS